MAIFELWSKRKKLAAKSGTEDIYTYDELPSALRVQVIHILNDAMGNVASYEADARNRWKFVHDTIAREIGVFQLTPYGSDQEKTTQWFLESASTDEALDLIELSFIYLEFKLAKMNTYDMEQQGIRVKGTVAIEELNYRFREHGVGYQYENSEIIRVDSKYIHAEITKPALSLLTGSIFKIANEDFMTAHKHYRNGECKVCIVACQRAFESTLKAISTLKGWQFNKSDGASELLKLVREIGRAHV